MPGDDQDVILFVDHRLMEEFGKLLGTSIVDEEGLLCRMKETYCCLEMKHICEYFDIELEEIFEKEKEY